MTLPSPTLAPSAFSMSPKAESPAAAPPVSPPVSTKVVAS
jgi:hypothetical protein